MLNDQQKNKKQLPKENKGISLNIEDLPPELREKFSKLPPEGQEAILSVAMHSEKFQGPFPHPKHAAEYEKICPGFLGRSLTMAEKAQAANIDNGRLQLENERLALQNQGARDKLDSRDTARGQYLGFAALIILIAAALIAMWAGHDVLAYSFFGGGVMLVIGRFLVGKFSAGESKDES